jgi:hypothetical protein
MPNGILPKMFMSIPATQIPRPLQGKYWDTDEKERITAACGNKLFAQGKIFEQLRLPSFEQDSKSSVVYKTDNSLGGESNPLRKMRWSSKTSLMMDLRQLAKDA